MTDTTTPTDRVERAEAERDRLSALLSACPQGHTDHACCDCPTPTEQKLMEDYERAHDDRMKENATVKHVAAERDALAAKLEAAEANALNDAADAIQALHPGEVKNSVIFLRERAAVVQSVQETDQ